MNLRRIRSRVENDRKAETPNEKTNAAAPNTADATSAGMLVCIFTASGAGIAALYIKRRALSRP